MRAYCLLDFQCCLRWAINDDNYNIKLGRKRQVSFNQSAIALISLSPFQLIPIFHRQNAFHFAKTFSIFFPFIFYTHGATDNGVEHSFAGRQQVLAIRCLFHDFCFLILLQEIFSITDLKQEMGREGDAGQLSRARREGGSGGELGGMACSTFKTNSCLFQAYNILLPYSIINMTFTLFVPQKQLQNASHHTNERCFPPPHSAFNDSPYLLPQMTISANQQHTNAMLEPKKQGLARLGLKEEPSDEKMRRINQRRGGYKRSTNNSHKKFICVAKRLLFRQFTASQRAKFDGGFDSFKNSRTYYFIILAHAKLCLNEERVGSFQREFAVLMRKKIEVYRKEVERASNRNFIQFRCDEIADIQFALAAFALYFEGKTQAAIEAIYKKDKQQILKKHQFDEAVKAVLKIEAALCKNRQNRHVQQDVIILQQNQPLSGKQSDDEEIAVQPTQHTGLPFPHLDAYSQLSFQMPRGSNQEQIQMPLQFLEHSYPYFDYFYEIMFPFQVNSQEYHLQYLLSCMQYGQQPPFMPDSACLFQDNPFELVPPRNSVKDKLSMGKTAADEQIGMKEGLDD